MKAKLNSLFRKILVCYLIEFSITSIILKTDFQSTIFIIFNPPFGTNRSNTDKIAWFFFFALVCWNSIFYLDLAFFTTFFFFLRLHQPVYKSVMQSLFLSSAGQFSSDFSMVKIASILFLHVWFGFLMTFSWSPTRISQTTKQYR